VKRSRLLATILIFVGLVGGLLTFQAATGRSPVLGLDLKGGLSVIYATAEPASEDDLIVVRDLMRDQLEDFGIAEPDVRVEGDNIIVDLPGVTDQAEAFEALQVSGIVELRPVLQCQATAPPTSSVPGSSVPGSSVPGSSGSTIPGASLTGSTAPPTTVATADAGSATEESAAGRGGGGYAFPAIDRSMIAAPSATPSATTTPASVPPTSEPAATAPATSVALDVTATTAAPIVGPTVPTTTTTIPFDQTGQDFLTNADGTEACLVGPAAGTGEIFERGSAEVGIDPQTGGWLVAADLRGEGEAQWNAIAAECFNGAPTCPSAGVGTQGRLAIVLDDVIQTAPTVQQPSFSGTVQISGSFSEGDARSLARVLNRGAFPVQVEQQRVETVSPTAGEDSLDAAVFAGLFGVALTMLYMIAYYRRLSVVIILGLVVWAALVYVLSTWVSRETNYAFTIAGATGIIVSIGVTIDTYIVYFERLKDEIRSGRTLRNAAPRAFAASWKTILAANTVALLSAVVLFVLSVGSVKGFALYLGMTSVCDLIVFALFTRPALYLLSDTRWFGGSSAKTVGIGTAMGGAS
jgi:preprotein translocase subunit SecD